MVQFALEDPEPLLYHNEPIYRDGKLVGHTTSANYGHTLGRAIALGYLNNPDGVDQAWIDGGKFEIEVACERDAGAGFIAADVRSQERTDARLVQSVLSAYWTANSPDWFYRTAQSAPLARF